MAEGAREDGRIRKGERQRWKDGYSNYNVHHEWEELLILKVHICTFCPCIVTLPIHSHILHTHPLHTITPTLSTHPLHSPHHHTHPLHTTTPTLSTYPLHSPHHHTHPLHTSLTFSTPPHSPSPHIPHIFHTTTTTLSTHTSHSPHHHTHPLHKLFLLWGLPVGRNITIPADTTNNIYCRAP